MAHAADVVILGAGLGGSATALALLTAGISRVVLVDQPVRNAFRIGESATPDVPQVLDRLGVPSDMAALGHRPCQGTLSLWGGRRVFNDYLRKGRGPGWHLDRAAFDAFLRDQAVGRGARLLCPDGIDHLVPRAEGWRLTLKSGLVLDSRIVVDAAGRGSPLATGLGATRHRLDDLVAVAVLAPFDHDDRLAGMSLVEPFADGWWYAARIPDGRAVVTLMTDADISGKRGFTRWDSLAEAWAETTELRHLVPRPDPTEISVFAAHSTHLDRAAGAGWLAVGDALLGFDPLTSSGMAGALNDAVAAADTIQDWLGGGDPAPAAKAYEARAAEMLARYGRDRARVYGEERRWADRPFWERRVGKMARAQATLGA
jgi:2-polyprenyl-6-methoxyphenol hydroxylase-like FAD-dependent oxidoreductase